jgi:rsbT co-antagonist protein RsbR
MSLKGNKNRILYIFWRKGAGIMSNPFQENQGGTRIGKDGTSKEQEEIHRLEMLVEKRTAELSNVIKELSSPVIPVLNHTVVIPLFGKFEDPHATELNEKILKGIVQYEAKYLLLDLTAVKELDEFLPYVIHNLTNSIRLLGAETFLVGISPDISTGIVRSQMDLNKFTCFTTLQHALQHTLFIEGLEIRKR